MTDYEVWLRQEIKICSEELTKAQQEVQIAQRLVLYLRTHFKELHKLLAKVKKPEE